MRVSFRHRCILTVFSAFQAAFYSAPLSADVTGSILGTVRDPSSATVAGAQISATNLDTNLSRRTVSDASGQYRILALPVGRYSVQASAAGFERFVTTGIALDVNEQRRIDIGLQVGNIQQEVEVNTASLQIETASTQLGQVIDQKTMLTLPLNGRSYIDLLGLQAGVAPGTTGSIQQDRPVSGNLSSGNVSVNGQRETANAFLVNGGDVSEGRNLGTAIIPNIDSVQEFRLITNSFDPEYGKFSGAVMNAITKSGTNGFHGTAFEFLRNSDLDARNFFSPERDELKRNQFGYAVGGPALKNRLFWFTDYQATRQAQGLSNGLQLVPSAAERAGDFSALAAPDVNGHLNAFVDPNNNPLSVNGSYWAQLLSQRLGYTVTSGEPYGGCGSIASCVFPGNTIPLRAFSTPTLGTLKYIPLPNSGIDNYVASGQNQKVVDDKAGQRVDIINKLTGNWFIYYFFDDATVNNPLPFANVPGFPSTTPSRAQEAVLSNTHIFGPSTVNEARLSFTRTSVTTDEPKAGFGTLSSFGFVEGTGTLGIVPSGPPGFEGLPQISFNNLGLNLGSPQLTTTQPNNTWHASEGLSRIFGRHSTKFGGEFRYFQINERNVCSPNGDFSFDGSETGNDIADYLLGAPASYVQCSEQFLDSRTRYGGAYAQDSFRIRPNVTLNYGLRWEVSMPWYDTQNKIETIVPGEQSIVFPTAPKGWVVPGDPGIPSTLAPTRYNNFAPRVGLAWSPGFSDGPLKKIFGGGGKTSVRAAYGIYYSSIEDLNLFYEVGDAPYGLYWPSISPPLFDQPFLTRSDGMSQGQRFPFVFPVPGSPANATLDYSRYLPIQSSPGYDIHNRLPYAEHYNFSIERQLGSATELTLAYVGTQGHRLIAERESNPGNPALCLALRAEGATPQCGPNQENTLFTLPDGTTVNGTRGPLGPNFGSDAFTANIANSNYNSLQVSVERRAADLTFLAAYTYSKAIDDASGFSEWVNFSNYRLSRSLSQYDLTHNFVISYDYAVPFSRAFSGAPKRLTQGWEITGITRFSTGFPIGIGQSDDLSLVGSGSTDVPNLIGPLRFQDPRKSGPDGPNEYFFASAFTSGPLGGFGSSNRRFFHGPGIDNWDLALHKTTQIRESMSVQFRAEFFNVFNHTQFNNPNGNFSSGQFGLVTSARDPRIGQLSLKFLW